MKRHTYYWEGIVYQVDATQTNFKTSHLSLRADTYLGNTPRSARLIGTKYGYCNLIGRIALAATQEAAEMESLLAEEDSIHMRIPYRRPTEKKEIWKAYA